MQGDPRADCDVERTCALHHGDDAVQIGSVMDLIGYARTFTSEKKRIADFESGLSDWCGCFCGEKNQSSVFSGLMLQKRRPPIMALGIDLKCVIHRRATKGLVCQRKPKRTDYIDVYTETCCNSYR